MFITSIEYPKGSDHTCLVNLGSLEVNVAINELDRHILSTVTRSSHKTGTIVQMHLYFLMYIIYYFRNNN